MRVLFHEWLSPRCRAVRVILAEKNLDFSLRHEKIWERRPEFLALNPAGTVPVLVETDGRTLAGAYALYEFLEEFAPEPSLIGGDADARAEIRRLVSWFDEKFQAEVTDNLVGEKLIKRFAKSGDPQGAAIRAGNLNIHYHLEYIGWLTDRRNWLAGDSFSLADIVAACQLSCVDYANDVPWAKHAGAKDWYMKIKCRPSFRALLSDHVPGCPPPPHYSDLDF